MTQAFEVDDVDSVTVDFTDIGLIAPLEKTLAAIGYESPSAIQAATIPKLLAGGDLLGQAQTGTGKTAAFALPILSKIDLKRREPQAIVLTPTRELAIQVAEAFQKYAKNLEGFSVLPIYGGQAYPLQLRPLERGVHVVVGTPGRVIDHLKRGSLNLSSVRHFVLDESDEMLKMGFVDDVDTILAKAHDDRQIVLFSATMPEEVKRLAETYMRNPDFVQLEVHTTIAPTIRQRYLITKGNLKFDALTRILETETYDAMLVFARTKNDTAELAEKLSSRGYAVAPLNGDIPQKQRERTVDRLKEGKLDIIVATDVAARGLDVQRISHVLNYDLPTGIEPYTHRIGRTGRAGRKGDAILFIKPNERRVLASIERATGGKLEVYTVPTTDEVNASRIDRFKESVKETMDAGEDRSMYARIVQEIAAESGKELVEVATALAEMATGDSSLLFQAEGAVQGRERTEDEHNSYMNDRGGNRGRYDRNDRNDRGPQRSRFGNDDRGGRFERNDRGPRPERSRFGSDDRGGRSGNDQGGRFGSDQGGRFGDKRAAFAGDRAPRGDDRGGRFGGDQGGRFGSDQGGRFGDRRESKPMPGPSDEPGMIRYRVEVGRQHGVNPGNIVGAVANEGDISSQFIGRIEIFDNFSTIDLPEGMPQDTFRKLQRTNVRGQQLRIAELNAGPGPRPGRGNYTSPNDRV